MKNYKKEDLHQKWMFARGERVFFNCSHPATGYIKRIAKDGSWADVQWNAGLNYRYVRRVQTKYLLSLSIIINDAIEQLKKEENKETI